MKKLSQLILKAAVLSTAFILVNYPQNMEAAPAKADNQGMKARFFNFKACVENSKIGKLEQSNFDSLKKQMETMLGEKDKTLNELSDKLNDPDYLDSLSPEAETELKRKFRTLSQEMSQQQSQYMQSLQQANFKVLEKLDDLIAKASEVVAKKNGYTVVINDESTFYYDKDLDISNEIVAVMDELYEKESKEPKEKPAGL